MLEGNQNFFDIVGDILVRTSHCNNSIHVLGGVLLFHFNGEVNNNTSLKNVANSVQELPQAYQASMSSTPNFTIEVLSVYLFVTVINTAKRDTISLAERSACQEI